MINGSSGIELETGVVWYPDQDLEEFEGQTVQVTIERIGEAPGATRIGFLPAAKPERKKKRKARRKR